MVDYLHPGLDYADQVDERVSLFSILLLQPAITTYTHDQHAGVLRVHGVC